MMTSKSAAIDAGTVGTGIIVSTLQMFNDGVETAILYGTLLLVVIRVAISSYELAIKIITWRRRVKEACRDE